MNATVNHTAGAAAAVGPGEPVFMPWCSCGWRGPTAPTREQALRAANEHADDAKEPM